MAGRLGKGTPVPRLGREGPGEVLPPGDVPLPFGQDPYGPREELLHRRRDRPVQEDEGLQRAPSHGVGRLRHARGKRGHPARRASGCLDQGEHRLHEETVEAPRLRLRLGQGDRHVRRRVLRLGAVDLPEDVRKGARLPEERARQLLRAVPDRARQRAGRGRQVLAVRLGGDPERAGPVVLRHHPVRRRASRIYVEAARLAGTGAQHAEELDRQELRGGGRFPPGKRATSSRSSPRGPTRSTA